MSLFKSQLSFRSEASVKEINKFIYELENELQSFSNESMPFSPVFFAQSILKRAGYFGNLNFSFPDLDHLFEEIHPSDSNDEDYVEGIEPLSLAEKQAVAEIVDSQADCEYGITWDTLRDALRTVLAERDEPEELDEECKSILKSFES